MAGAITWTKGSSAYSCGNDYHNVRIFNFIGPSGGKLTAYSCNMNLDLDADPQAYAPLSRTDLRPKDGLGNAGFKYATGKKSNQEIKDAYEAGKTALADLEKKKADLLAAKAAAAAKAAPAGTAPTPAPPPAAPPASGTKPPADPIAELDKQIKAKKAALANMSFEHKDANDNYSATNPKNFEKIFWKWYGVTAMTPQQAKNEPAYLEMTADKITLRKPQLDQTAAYEDVFGRFPVVQSIFEPGTDYFVSPIPHQTNTKYRYWDQRYYLPTDSFAQTAFGALSTYLKADNTKLDLGDTVFAIRLDTTDTLAFPFRDVGFGQKVAECSFAAFTGLGGVYHEENVGAAKFPNTFQLIYLAFPLKKTPVSVLNEFATATNADEFPVMLAFIAQATADAPRDRTTGQRTVGADPMVNFASWKKAAVKTKPPLLDVIVQGLGSAGSTFVQRMAQKHGSVIGSGPFLTPPAMP